MDPTSHCRRIPYAHATLRRRKLHLEKVMALRLRCRSSQGTVALQNIEPSTSLWELRQMLEKHSGVAAEYMSLMTGYPPKEITAGPSSTLAEAKLRSGDMITIKKASQPIAHPTELSNGSKGSAKDAAPPLMAASTVMQRYKMPDDNSCLFHAIAFCLQDTSEDKSEDSDQLRGVCAAVAMSDPDTYSEAFLGMPNSTYPEHIMNPDKWGGAIESSILSTYFKAEICAIDVETKKQYLYGEGCGYRRRAYLLYTGIHYDVIVAMRDSQGLSAGDAKQVVQRCFNTEDLLALESALHVVEQAHKERAWTNTNSFTLRCDACGQGLVGAAGAQTHATATGHTAFSEYK